MILFLVFFIAACLDQQSSLSVVQVAVFASAIWMYQMIRRLQEEIESTRQDLESKNVYIENLVRRETCHTYNLALKADSRSMQTERRLSSLFNSWDNAEDEGDDDESDECDED